ncbi:tetratricopeptide repeat protein [Stella sp.]|uniref:tetratricopeptide repeat protein n=1 Tax=Stella sp. TaxID=2912054 RepID=UPI0035AF4EDE
MALKSGDLDAAIAALRAAIERHPDLPDAWRRLGIAHSRKYRMGEAAVRMAAIATAAGHATGLLVAAQMAAQARDLPAATRLAEAAVAADGAGEEAFLLLGRLLRQRRDHAAAAAVAERAARLGFGGDKLRLARAEALLRSGRPQEALDALAPLLAEQPGLSPARVIENDALQQLKDPVREEAAVRAWIAADPATDTGHLRLVNLLVNSDRAAEAAPILFRLLREHPDDGRYHTLTAMVLHALGKERRGLPLAQRAVELLPDSVEAQMALATILNRLSRYEEAEIPARRAVELAPDLVTTRSMLALSLQRQNRFVEAESASLHAVALKPDDADAVANLATLQWMLERYEESLVTFDRALALRPDDAEIHFNRGMSHLALGDFPRAWADIGWRWKRRKSKWRPFPQPWWDGGPLAGRIVVWGDQGVGDEVLAAGLLPDLVRAVPAGVALECEPRLVPLIRRSMPAIDVHGRVDPIAPPLLAPDIVAQVPAVDLANHLRRDAASFRPHAGYLVPDPGMVARLRARYREAAGGGPVIGISWRSTNPRFGVRKTFELPGWAPILAAPGAVFVSLQYGDVAAETAAAATATGARILADPEVDSLVDLDLYAAQVAAMDLVVTVSNTAAHVAGAVGAPTWLMLPRGNGLLWYWLLCQGEHCPWYPSIRVFRQERVGDWSGMVERLGRMLAERGVAPAGR